MSVTIQNLTPNDTTVSANPTLQAEVLTSTETPVKFYAKRSKNSNLAFRFIVMTDGHWNLPNQEAENAANFNTLKNVANQMNSYWPVSFLVAIGDIVHDNHSFHAEVKTAFFDELDMSWYPVFGNHDWSTDEQWESQYGISKNHTFEVGDYGFIIVETGIPNSAQWPGSYSPGDASWVETQINNFTTQGKKGVLVFQHISPLETTDDAYAAPDADMRTQYARDIVKMSFHGHHHQLNFPFEKFDHVYMYACRIGGPNLSGNNYPNIDMGFQLVEVFTDGTVNTKQIKLSDESLINQHIYYDDEDGFVLVSEQSISSSETLTVPLNSLKADSRYLWYAEAGEATSPIQTFNTDNFGQGIQTQSEGVLLQAVI